MKNFVTKALGVLSILAVVWIGGLWIYHFAPSDRNGNAPEQISDQFVAAVNSRNWEVARSFWDKASIGNFEKNLSSDFREVCIRLFACDDYEIGSATRQKEVLFSVGFKGAEKGKAKSYRLYLRQIDDEWRIVEEGWLK